MAHLAPLPQHVQVLQAVAGQVAQCSLSQQQVLVRLTDEREAQTLNPQPQSARLLRERVSGSEPHHAAVGVLQSQILFARHRLHYQPTRGFPGQRDSTPDLSETQKVFRH